MHPTRPTPSPSRLAWAVLALSALVAGAPHAAARPAKPDRTDQHGAPRPDGAVARLGTLRWRPGASVALTAFLPDGKSLLTVNQDFVAQVWDADGREVRRFDAGGTPADPDDPNARALSLAGTLSSAAV